jgi:hypothetical protein
MVQQARSAMIDGWGIQHRVRFGNNPEEDAHNAQAGQKGLILF